MGVSQSAENETPKRTIAETSKRSSIPESPKRSSIPESPKRSNNSQSQNSSLTGSGAVFKPYYLSDGHYGGGRAKEGQTEGMEEKGKQRELEDGRPHHQKKWSGTSRNKASKLGNKKSKKGNEDPPEVLKHKKRLEERASFALMDTLSRKCRQKLLSIDSVLPFSGSSFIRAMLKIHNSYRADHGVPPLKLSKELNKIALIRSEALVSFRSNREIPKYIPELPPNMSENVYFSMTDNRAVPGAALACTDWYSGAYNFDYDDFNKRIGKKTIAFVNMIWKETRQMGAGRAVSSTGKAVIVAIYFPKADPSLETKHNLNPPIMSTSTLGIPSEHYHPNQLPLKAL